MPDGCIIQYRTPGTLSGGKGGQESGKFPKVLDDNFEFFGSWGVKKI
jgi:hypothetical protein